MTDAERIALANETLPEALSDVEITDGIMTAAHTRDAGYLERIEVTERTGFGCEHCGRKVGKRDLYVFNFYGGEIVHPDDVRAAMDSDAYDSWIGWCRVGPSCAKAYKGWTLTHAAWLKREGL